MSSLEKPILTWFKKNKRDLPWRETTPWGVMVSEYMLQQTPVNRVLPKWQEWMERWPTPKDLAEATPAQVITAWGRLGYPRRALRLHAAAQIIAEDFNNQVPEDQETLQLLPGIGEYTAAAIAAFAFEQRSLVMDVNIRRLLVRAIDGEEHPKPAPTAKEKARRLAILPEKNAHLWAAATMELGALVCTSIGARMVIQKQILLENLKIGMAPIANAEEQLFKLCARMSHSLNLQLRNCGQMNLRSKKPLKHY
jgi:A/G-specific adenine glycosylase